MKYKITEIFYSLIGEGAHAGKSAAFIRLAGCNLKCPFCDTEDPKDPLTLTAQEILEEIKHYPTTRCLITGGEPTLQNLTPLIEALTSGGGFQIHLETNGTRPLPHLPFRDHPAWVALSPKTLDLDLETFYRADEIKFLIGWEEDFEILNGTASFWQHHDLIKWVQPVRENSLKEYKKNVQKCIKICLDRPDFGLSLQIHKYLGVR